MRDDRENMYVVLAKHTYFGSTGEMSFGFITEALILSLVKGRDGRERPNFRSPAGAWFPHKERIRFFRTKETAQRWCDTHTVEYDGEAMDLVAVRYGSLYRNPFEQ